jgi:opacity protein-like surface antigen
MKKIIAAVMLTLFCSSMAMAQDVMTFPGAMGTVTFDHKMHKEKLKDCKVCHENGPGKIEGFGKDWAHKTCKGCHTDKGMGPTKCGECHKK